MNSIYTIMKEWNEVRKDLVPFDLNIKNNKEQKIINICLKYFEYVKLIESNTRLELKNGYFTVSSWLQFLIVCAKLKYNVQLISFDNKSIDLDTFNNTYVSDEILYDIKQINILLLKN